MSFVTIPNDINAPIMVNVDQITHIEPMENSINIIFSNGSIVTTAMRREILVDMLMKKEKQEPQNVLTQETFVG